MDDQPRSWKYKLTLAIILSLIAAVLIWIGIAGPVSGAPGWLAIPVRVLWHLSLLSYALLFAAPAFFLIGVYGAIRISRRNAKVNWAIVILAMAVAWPSTYFTYRSALGWRSARLLTATERAAPLIEAIESYNAARGEYPASLAALVPDYTGVIPDSGLLLYRDFKYLRQPDMGLSPKCEGYQLSLRCPLAPFSWDLLFYWPNNNGYPYEHHAAVVERIGNWGYVHD
jgi:hypothetical protein